MPFQVGLPTDGHHTEKDCTSEPKLVVRVRSEDGIPVDASLAPETRAYLQSLILPVKKPIRVDQCSSDSDRLSMAKSNSTDGDHGFVDLQKSCDDDSSATPLQRIMYHRVEVPLRNDNEFFHMLTVGISELNALQADEKAELTRDISSLGLEIAKIAAPSRSLSKTDLYAWRDIFSLYAECQVFFSTSEQDSFTRNTKMADKQLLTFYNKLRNLKFAQAFRKKESCLALNQFLQINTTLLRNLKFQELNMMAMTKILKSEYFQYILSDGETKDSHRIRQANCLGRSRGVLWLEHCRSVLVLGDGEGSLL